MRNLLIAAFALAAAGPALAQSDFPEPPMPQMSGPPMQGMRPPERESLAQMQANGDPRVLALAQSLAVTTNGGLLNVTLSMPQDQLVGLLTPQKTVPQQRMQRRKM